jgi:hypothetical protein
VKTGSLYIQALLFLFIALSPIQDFFLQGTALRGLGASPSIFPLAALAIITLSNWLMAGNFKADRTLIVCLGYVLLTAIYGFAFFGLTSHGESLIWKSSTVFVSLSVVVLAVCNVDYQINAVTRAAIYTAFGLVVLGFCFSSANPFGLPQWLETSILHFTPTPDLRPRGLASEPSEFSITAVAFGLLSTHVAQSRVSKVILFFLTVGLLVASGSKGGISTLFICGIIVSIIKWHSKWYQVAALTLLLFPVGIVAIWMIPNLFPEDSLSVAATVPTRLSMLFCAITTIEHHPFGVGLPGFLPAVATYLPGAINTTQSMFPVPLNFSEVTEYMTSADMVSTKTFVFDQMMRFGLPFGVFFFLFVSRLIKGLVARKQIVMTIAVLASTIAITTYIPGTGAFPIPIVFGVALSQMKKCSEFF